ncbi:hypothetical protein [Emticicia aquatilis]|uniref:hypothetical protein n=1 Tax=Emticicia aquatilis TaxID=1537369 RepID=UPI00166835AC|nr:hypothetical protein [Emticicia aquatilis]
MQTTALITNIIFDIAFIPSLVLIYVSLFVFDNGTDGTGRWLMFTLFNSIPASILVTQIISWVAYSNGHYDFAFKVSLVPLIFVLLIGLWFLRDYLTK